ncbi:cytosolic endo-beta-N-acetylglucosaminidase isoform X1 [Drosophila sulfurigaster albostrigata]|uniref:cytosolic endo-beta-N-acetylglucosaminidase isoform X1 n=1 Tax=Drosophila sulfurigaster albostrigata TaxID=89887 RepID=UPI002D21A767|nr:cytosolic endo-beta-N-acetylglucosaminidase isoform X1 [Drosophila sulfurigaster albostrigata]
MEQDNVAGVAAADELPAASQIVEAQPNAGYDYEAQFAGKQLCEFCSTQECTCGCPQLEAQPLLNNTQLLNFEVRSRNIDWRRYVRPLDTQVRGSGVYLDAHTDLLGGHRREVNAENQRELLVCHDMMGNYLADRHYHSSQKFDDYRFVHWSAVDYFCYFSHNYVTIPPSGWLNAAHRHGVPVLGTYIVEGSAGNQLLEELLASRESVQRAVAALTRLCLHFCFEGWLINVEHSVRESYMPNLYLFVDELRRATESQVPHGRVFWYDSIIDSGTLRWQNELNEQNVRFFRHSQRMLINYTWNDKNLAISELTVVGEAAPKQRVFMGLDVFGRNQLAGFESAQTLARVASRGFSAGIFAPAWCYETLQDFGYDIRNEAGNADFNAAFLQRNEKWWSSIWQLLATHPYRRLPFYTDFGVGSGCEDYVRGTRHMRSKAFFNLARQSLQPSVPLHGNAEHSFDTAFEGGSALRVLNFERAFRLFVTDFELPLGVLLLGYAYKLTSHQPEHQQLDIVLRCCPLRRQGQQLSLYLFCGDYAEHIITPGRCYLQPINGVIPRHLVPQQLPAEHGLLGEGWRMRYYVARFDGPVRVLDIGLKCRRETRMETEAETQSEAYLGAIFVQSLQLSDWTAVHQTTAENKALISAYHGALFLGAASQ